MRLSFERIKELRAFRGKTELATAILKQYESLVERVRDPVILGAHLYALELTGAQDAMRKAVVATLDRKELRQDPMVAQTAGKIATRLVRRKFPCGKDLRLQGATAWKFVMSTKGSSNGPEKQGLGLASCATFW